MTKKIEDALAWLSVDEQATHNADMQADLIAARIELATLEDATWNAALEAAAKAAETEAGSCLAGLPGFSSSAGVMSEVEAATLNAFAKTIRTLKRGQP